jgi:hypothetical protein
MTFQNIIDHLPGNMVCIHDNEGHIEYHNELFEHFFAGDSGDRLKGVNIHDLLEAGIVESPKLSYSNSYREIILQNPLQERLYFRLFEQELEEGKMAKIFQETTHFHRIQSQLEELQKKMPPSYQQGESGAFPRSFLENELPITYSAYSRTGHRMALVLFEINELEDLRIKDSQSSADYVYNETTQLIRQVLRRREDFVIQFSECQILLCLFNLPLWRPKGSSMKKTVEDIVTEIQETVSRIEIPHHSLRHPMDKVQLNAGIIESMEREALSSLKERVQKALVAALAKGKGKVEINVPAPF